MAKKAKQIIEKRELPDCFWVGDRWQVTKQDGKYRVLDIAQGGQDKPMKQRGSWYLQAFYSAQQHGQETWISIDEIAALAIAPGADSSGNTHKQHLSYLRNLFPDGLIKTRPGRQNSAHPTTLYKLSLIIRPVEEEAEKKPQEEASYIWHVLGAAVVIVFLFFWFTAISQTDETAAQLKAVNYDLSMRYSRGDDETEYLFEQGQILHSGDRLRLTIRPSEAAYLYLFYIDASKVAHRLFPPAQLNGLPRNYQNPLDADFPLHLPSRESAYRLDENIGYDALTIIATNQAVAHLDPINPDAFSSVDSEHLGTLTPLNRPALEQRLTELRHEFAQTCPNCIRTIEIIHR